MNKLVAFVYQNLIKKIFFLQDPEIVHDTVSKLGENLGKFNLTKALTGLVFNYKNKKLEQTILGINFKNPIGLAAGFDKDAHLTQILPYLGFGFEEVGSITGEPCFGNSKPRLWRLINSQSLMVYYGLKNDGCEIISQRLQSQKFNFPIGTSIAKTNSALTVDRQKGIEDYAKAFRAFVEIGDYYTINISCPNAFGGQPFTDSESFDHLMSVLDLIPTFKPIFVKLSPDLTYKEIDSLLEVSNRHRVHGFVLTNLTKNRNNLKIKDQNIPEVGGMSGRIVQEMSDNLISYIYNKTGGKYIIIGCGGVFSAEDAYKKIKLGASLIQLITGMIYQGPQVINEINKGLVKLLEQDGYKNISQAIGTYKKSPDIN